MCRISLPNTNSSITNDSIAIDELLCSNIHLSATGKERLRDETVKDANLQHLIRIIVNGWPEVRKDCPSNLHSYWNFRDDISLENQLLFKGGRVIVPETLQQEIFSSS